MKSDVDDPDIAYFDVAERRREKARARVEDEARTWRDPSASAIASAPPRDLNSAIAVALEKYRARCFWNVRIPEGAEGAKMIAERLKSHGDMAAWRLAGEIEALDDAVDPAGRTPIGSR